MITDSIVKISTAAMLTMGQLTGSTMPSSMLASQEMSLEKRYYPVQKENILLNIAYMDGTVTDKSNINWDEIQKPFSTRFRLEPGQIFAFHDDVLPEYQGKIALTTNAHFNFQEGFKSAGYLVGDGVCHLASLIYWAALDAGLKTEAPTNHNFMAIPEIDKKYGVSIYAAPGAGRSDAKQNLYITNNKTNPITFHFDYDGDKLKVSIIESN